MFISPRIDRNLSGSYTGNPEVEGLVATNCTSAQNVEPTEEETISKKSMLD